MSIIFLILFCYFVVALIVYFLELIGIQSDIPAKDQELENKIENIKQGFDENEINIFLFITSLMWPLTVLAAIKIMYNSITKEENK